MAEMSFAGGKTLLEKRIEQFCESSTVLLTNIHTRRKSMAPGASREKKRIIQRESFSIPEMDMDFCKEEPSEGLI